MKTNKIKEEIENLKIDIIENKVGFSQEEQEGFRIQLRCLEAELKGYQQATADFIKMIDFKIKDLKKRKPKLLAETSKYAMQMSIEELEELKQMLVEK